MTAQSRSVVVRLSLDTVQAMRASKEFGAEVDRAMDKAESSTRKTGAAIDDLGSKAGKVGAAAALGLAAVSKAAMDWESQWTGVTKTVDGSAEEMAQLEEELRGLAKTLPATHEEIAGVAEAAGQLGVAREDITDFTKTMVDLGETTNLTAEDAATSIAQISNVMGTAGDDVDNFGAALVALGNDGASTEAQILGMTQRIAGAGAQIGLAESDILAIANAAASMGIEVEAGGSAISRVFTSLAKATAQGGDDLEAFAEVAGMSAEEFAQSFEADPARAFASFTEGLNRINESGGDVFTTLDQLKLSDVRVSQALLGMAASGDLLTDSLDLGAQAWEENTALANEASKRYGTTASQVQVAWNQIKDAGIQAGEALLPVIADVAGVVGGMADAFGRLPQPVQNSLTGLLGITAVLGGGLWFTSKVISGIESTRASLDTLSGSSDKSSRALRGVALAGAGLTVLTAAGMAIDSLRDSASGSVPDINKVTEGLLNLGDAELSAQFDDLDTSLERLNAGGFTGFLDNVNETADKVPYLGSALATGFSTLTGSTGQLNEAAIEVEHFQKQMEGLDAALAGLVASGGAERAQQAFADLAEQQGLTAEQQEQLLDLLPEYESALTGAANAADLDAEAASGAADATIEYGEAAKASAEAAQAEAKAIRDSIKAMEEKRDAALGAFDAETRWREALKTAQKAAEKNSAGIQGNTKAALDNRDKLSALAGAWNDLSNKAQNTPGRFKAARDAFIQTATDMGVPKKAAEVLADKLLEIPNKVVTKATVEDQQALAAIEDVFSHLNALDGKVATTYIHTVHTGGGEPDYVSGGRAHAGGGYIYGPGSGTSDSIPARLSNGEYVVKAAAVSKYGVAMMDTINAQRFADGGPVGDAGDRRSLDDRLAIAQILQQIRDYRRSLAADGKDKLEGLNRRIALLQLQAAEKELRLAKNREEREARQAAREAARERRAAIRAAGQGLSFDSIVPDDTPVTVAAQVRSEIDDFKASVIDAGGEWTKAMREWAHDMMATARQYDHLQTRLANEVAKRDALVDTLADQQRALDDLNATMKSYAATVAGNFLNDPFNQSITRAIPGGGADPALASALAAAQTELAAIRSSAGLDSVTSAAQASRLMQQIARLQASIDEAPTEETLTGAAALKATLEADAADARAMAEALATLAGKGLDTNGDLGGLYQELAASGDLQTARELAAMTEEQIAEYEALYADRAVAAATVAAQATQAVYGDQQAVLLDAIADTNALIDRSNFVLAVLNQQLDVLGAEVRAGAEAGADLLKPQLHAIKESIDALPRKIQQAVRQDGGR